MVHNLGSNCSLEKWFCVCGGGEAFYNVTLNDYELKGDYE